MLKSAAVDSAKLRWATGELALASYAAVSSIYVLFYATEVLHIRPAWAGLALLIPNRLVPLTEGQVTVHRNIETPNSRAGSPRTGALRLGYDPRLTIPKSQVPGVRDNGE